MVSSAKLALFAVLYSIRSKSSNLSRRLRAFVLRGLLLLSYILRKSKKIWSWYSQLRSSDGKKTMGNAGSPAPGSAGMSRNPEEYGIIYASRVSQPSSVYSTSRSGGPEESIPLEDVTEQSRGPSFATAPPSPDSPRHPAHPLPTGNTASSLQAETTPGMLIMSNPPITWTHPRVTSSTFTGASSRSRPRTPSPSASPTASPTALPAAPPSPSSSRRYFFRPNTPERLDIEIAISSPMTQDSQHPPQVSAGSSDVSVQIEPPSPSVSTDSQPMFSVSQPRPSSSHHQTQGLPTQPSFPSPGPVSSSAESSHSGGYDPSMHGEHATSLHISTGSSQGDSQDPLLTRGSPGPSSPVPIIPGQMLGANASAAQLGSGEGLRKMHPEEVSRHKKKGDVPKENNRFWLMAMDLDLSSLVQFKQVLDGWDPVIPRDSGEWIPVTHPGGALYFYHERFRAFTDVYMYDPDLRAQVDAHIDYLERQYAELNPNWGPMSRYDLVLDIIEKDKRKIPHYYYVDHDKRTLFWLDGYDLSDVLYEVPGVQEPDHIRHRLEALYWAHWSLYPRGYRRRHFPADACDELLGVLLSNSIDSLTSSVSTTLFSTADIEKMHGFIKDARDLGTMSAYAISSVARLLSIFAKWKFVHFHGQKTSRQDRNKSIYVGGGHKRTKPFRMFSLFLFLHPDVHLRELNKVWVDELVYDEAWRNFMVMLQSEWEKFILNLTVMLAANVSFLAIPGVIPDQMNAWAKPSSAQVASCMSLVFSIGGIISGLLLIRSTHTLAGEDTKTAWMYLNDMKKPHFYFEPLAITYSLPYGLLMWSVCAFFIALLLITFSKTREEIRIPVGVTVGLVGLLMIWCIVNLWDGGKGHGDGDSEPLMGD